MNKEKFLKILQSLEIDEVDAKECQKIKESGVTYAFRHLTEEEIESVIKYLIRYPHIYYNRYIKCIYGVEAFKKIKNYTDEIKETIWEYHRYFYHQYVGPFFYIDNEIKALLMDVVEGNIKDEFINNPASHFDYSKMLGLDDYGHYPRGRVIYNNMTNEYYVYMDKSLHGNNKIIDMVLNKFNLYKPNVVIKTDSHYTHDYLQEETLCLN